MKKLIVSVWVVIFLFMSLPLSFLAADTVVPPTPPQALRVVKNGYLDATGYNWYAEFAWNPSVFPGTPVINSKGMIFSLDEIVQGTGAIRESVMEIPFASTVTGFKTNEYLPEDLSKGTIYDLSGRSWYKYGDVGETTVTSQKSAPIRFLTGLDVTVSLIPGTNNVKIKWNDVWDSTGRINYRILISDTKGFTQPPAVPDILASEIGKAGSPVTVNNQDKSLEYTYTYALPGREYAIKVVPLPGVKVNTILDTDIVPVYIKTDILLKAQKVGYTEDGVLWKLFWNAIVKGSTFKKVDYELYRYVNADTQGSIFALVPELDYFYLKIPNTDTNSYSFRIDAKAYPTSGDVPVEFRSNSRVQLIESIPEIPKAPELVDAFPNADPSPLVYDTLLGAKEVTLLWNAPMTGLGEVDTDITYDIYLTSDVRDVATLPTTTQIGGSISMGASNEVRDIVSGKLLGYKYRISNLKSNSTYYFTIQARKNYLVQDPLSDFTVSTPFLSKPSTKVIITKPDVGTDRPLAPPSPPFQVKEGIGNITFTTANLIMKKMWHQLYDPALKKWEYVTKDEYDANLLVDDADKRLYMIVNYPPGWIIKPHVVADADALFAVQTLKKRDYVAYSDLSQAFIKNLEIAQTDVQIPNIPADADQTFGFGIKGLTHNTTYIVWLTVVNADGNISDPSDPIIITTPPRFPDVVIVPVVPTDLRGLAADTFVDLFWSFKSGLDYELKYSIKDDVTNAEGSKAVTYAEISARSYYRLEGLNPNTLYYIWIRAKNNAATTTGSGVGAVSDWSNPVILKTEAYRPPAPPTGFGVKEGSLGVTADSVTYEWVVLPKFTYTMDFAENSQFKEGNNFAITGGSYTKTGLESNRRYYARIYAIDPVSGLRSEPSKTIMVVTNRGRNEYDSSYDLDDIPSGDNLIFGKVNMDGVWTTASSGVNADRLAESIREMREPVVQIDLRNPPGKANMVRLELGTAVLDMLSDLNMDLLLRTPSSSFVLKPGAIQTDVYYQMKNQEPNMVVRFDVKSPVVGIKPSAAIALKGSVTDLSVTTGSGDRFSSLEEFVKPVQVSVPVTSLGTYQRNQISIYAYDNKTQAWESKLSSVNYTDGTISTELDKPVSVAAGVRATKSPGTMPAYVKESVDAIQKQFNLKTFEGQTIKSSSTVTVTDLSKMLLDMIPYRWSESSALQTAARAGLIASSDAKNPTVLVRRDQAIAAAAALYAKKTGDRITAPVFNSCSFCN
jgi:hypothetical protein